MDIPLPPVEIDLPEVTSAPARTFNSLEDRYNQTVNNLYAAAKYKFDNGRASLGANDDPLIVRTPGNGYWNFAESRSTPFASAFNDIKRLTLFTASRRGISFLLKQQLLQTGNTFESTRILNPAFHISNAVPFNHTKRMIDIPITGKAIGRAILGNNAISKRVFGSGDINKGSASSKSRGELTKIAQLQQETFNKVINRKDLIGGALKKIPVVGQVVSAVKAKRSMGEVEDGYTNSRPELAPPSKTTQAIGRGLSFVGGFLNNPVVGLIGTALENEDNSYIMTKQLLEIKSAFSSNTTIFFKPRYGPTASSNLYITYLEVTETGKQGVYIGRNLSQYKKIILLDSRQNNNSKKKKIEIFYPNQIIRPSISSRGNNIFEEWKASNDKKVVEKASEEYFNSADGVSISLASSQPVRSYIKYFKSGLGSIRTSKLDIANLTGGGSTNAQRLADAARTFGEEIVDISYLRDPLNSPKLDSDETIALKPYSDFKSSVSLPGKPPAPYVEDTDSDTIYVSDAVVVSFAMGRDSHIQFRAFIRDLQQSASPQYKDYQYIGRIEKFISYVTVQREISFKLDILAFSKDELSVVWKRINYMTGLVFPYGINKGILQPNIVRLTIGQVYTDQPGYITSLDTTFNEISPSWDIDQQVPIGATMTVRFKLIEKNVALADSPFYGINEGNSAFDRITEDETVP